MTLDELKAACLDAKQRGSSVVILQLPLKGRLSGIRGELLCETSQHRVMRYNVDRMLKLIKKNEVSE